jgi:threonine aldolase
VLCGDADFIDRARIWRKRLGGGMRQSGLLAACGIVSLTQMVDRLADDHRRAKELGSALNQIPGLRVDMETVETNMVLVHTETPATEWQVRLEAQGVWCFAVAPNRLRMVLHADIDDAKLAQAIAGAACA